MAQWGDKERVVRGREPFERRKVAVVVVVVAEEDDVDAWECIERQARRVHASGSDADKRAGAA